MDGIKEILEEILVNNFSYIMKNIKSTITEAQKSQTGKIPLLLNPTSLDTSYTN